MKNQYYTLFVHRGNFRALTVGLMIVSVLLTLAIQLALAPYLMYQVSYSVELAGFEINLRSNLVLEEKAADIYEPIVDAMMQPLPGRQQTDDLQAWCARMADMDGIVDAWIVASDSTVISSGVPVPIPTFVDSMIYHRKDFRYRDGRHLWVGSRVRTPVWFVNGDSLRLFYQGYDREGRAWLHPRTEPFAPDSIGWMAAVSIDENWIRRVLPPHMDSVMVSDESFMMASVLTREYGEGIIAFGDTLWWYGVNPDTLEVKADWMLQKKEVGFGASPFLTAVSVIHRPDSFLPRIRIEREIIRWVLIVINLFLLVSIGLLLTGLHYTRRQMLTHEIALSHASHAIRTPVARLRLAFDTLLGDRVESPEEEREILLSTSREVHRIEQSMRNAMLSLDRGALVADRQTLDVASAIRELIEAWRVSFEEHAIPLEVDIPDEPCDFHLDPELLRVLLDNLLDNALRHSRLKARESGTDDDLTVSVQAKMRENELIIRVEDQASGMEKAQLKRLFDPGRSTLGTAATGVTGQGLGLQLARRIAEAHRGDLTVENQPGRGLAVVAVFSDYE